ncbi:CHRD domain-containing protein [Streptomyces sp. NBC_01351]|uniref:CHRD domain-containing protein n=1 Tax=Streptomyces sp. NBC_01351 TaxID=2903833 RepID=UPI002E3538F1|nr:CHRD domain-containing protein [Streptomyces sp. NBC_01351]
MTKMRLLATTACLLAAGATTIAPAHADDGHGAHGAAPGTAGADRSAGSPAAFKAPSSGRAVTLVARLDGNQEVPVAGGPAVDDPDGEAVAFVQVQGDRVTFSLNWKGLTPSLGHVHEGVAGQNGAVKVPLFGTAMPSSVHSAAGQVAVTDAALAQRLRTDPAGFYVNLHSAEFPGGAVRGQLGALNRPVNPLSILKGGKLRALSNGAQEVPKNDTSKVGDPDGFAATFLQPSGTNVDYSLAWVNIKSPTLGHIHRGPFGKNGDVVFNLLDKPVPEGIFAVSGKLTGQKAEDVRRLQENPRDHYSNIHTAEFPDGAVRGQLFR